MEDNLNNENNNYVEPQKNNNGVKILLIIVIILLLAILLLLGYKVFIHNNKENNKGNDNNTIETGDKKYEKINYEVKNNNDEWNRKVLYVNNKKVNSIVGEAVKVEQYKDVLIVETNNPGPSRAFYVVDKNANNIQLSFPKTSYNPANNSRYESYRIVDSKIYIKMERDFGNGGTGYCTLNDDEIIYYEVEFEYLGNDKFSSGKIVEETKFINTEHYKLKQSDVCFNAVE